MPLFGGFDPGEGVSYCIKISRNIETAYGYGCQLLDDKEYDKAVSVFKELGSYKDSASKQLEAKYGMLLTTSGSKKPANIMGT